MVIIVQYIEKHDYTLLFIKSLKYSHLKFNFGGLPHKHNSCVGDLYIFIIKESKAKMQLILLLLVYMHFLYNYFQI